MPVVGIQQSQKATFIAKESIVNSLTEKEGTQGVGAKKGGELTYYHQSELKTSLHGLAVSQEG